jgi:hypothetical protein
MGHYGKVVVMTNPELIEGSGRSRVVRSRKRVLASGSLSFILVGLLLVVSCNRSFADSDSWFLVKDKDNVCKVVNSAEKPPGALKGPFATEALANEAMEVDCPKSTVDKLREKAVEGLEKARIEAEKLKTEMEELRKKAEPGIEAARGAAEKLKEKAGEGVEKAREIIRQHLPEKAN